MIISFVQYNIPACDLSIQDVPEFVLMNTPELAVNVPDVFLLPEYEQRSVPSFKTFILKGCPSVRGGFVSFVQVEAVPF